jgi:carbonic anhydrase
MRILWSMLIPLVYAYNYADLGPDTWPYLVEKDCGGLSQSPIDIDEIETTYRSTLKPFEFINYNQNIMWNLKNDGKGIVLSPLTNDTLRIDGSDFAEAFRLLQFHFHWGENDFQGSEHTINGRKFPLEVHFVHISNGGGLKVLGFLFELSQADNPDLDDLLIGISNAAEKSSTFHISSHLNEFIFSSFVLLKCPIRWYLTLLELFRQI